MGLLGRGRRARDAAGEGGDLKKNPEPKKIKPCRELGNGRWYLMLLWCLTVVQKIVTLKAIIQPDLARSQVLRRVRTRGGPELGKWWFEVRGVL